MKLKFHINYYTNVDESLFVNINNKSFAMQYIDYGWWIAEIYEVGKLTVNYFYSVKNKDGIEITSEWKNRKIEYNKNIEIYDIYDVWFGIDNNQAFYSSAFTKIVNKRNPQKYDEQNYEKTVEFRVNAPNISSQFSLAIVGNNDTFGNWKTPVIMHDNEFPLWTFKFDAAKLYFPCEFKFVLIDNETNEIAEWENCENRQFFIDNFQENECKIYTFETSLGNEKRWRGSGTAIPVFSLRTEESFGIGEFLDLKKNVDWLKKTNQYILQILPINDTTNFFDFRDSCPYSAISMYALHPIYINVEAMGKLSAENQLKYDKIKKKLNNCDVVDYEKVIKSKWKFFEYLFDDNKNTFLKSAEYKAFLKKNNFWLKPYSIYCTLRDKFKTSDFNRWKGYKKLENINTENFEKENSKSTEFYCFLQYHAHKQMKQASDYARKKGIILKGDIPIGINRNSVDVWAEPKFFYVKNQAGAPPDDFSVNGQNWGFPTYNWDAMRKNKYNWWISRFKKMDEYFDAYRMDHVLGFFRIWEIPFHSLQGLLGHFNPSLPYSAEELAQFGLPMNAQRYLKPYVRNDFVDDIFGKYADYVCKFFFNQIADNVLEFKSKFDTQRKIDEYFETENYDETQKQILKSGLFSLINNVLFVEDETKKNSYYPRIAAQLSSTYEELNDNEKRAFNLLYDEFYYRRNTELWKSQAMEKLPKLICATEMLACCEDLGMIPNCVPEVINDLKILSLEIQRMPKNVNVDFANPAHYPYLSVCTTSTHDTSTLRSWWKENFEKTKLYYNKILNEIGDAPKVCTGEILEKILIEHLKSPSMFAIFPLQDWLGIDEKLRRKNEDGERINTPSNPNNYWQYRMHINMEQLLAEDEFNEKIAKLANRN